MDTLTRTYDWLHTLIEVQLNLIGLRTRDERGALTTEMAVLMVALIGIAIIAGGLILTQMRESVDAIPDAVVPADNP